MVEHLEDPFGRTGEAVIESGNEIEQKQGKAVDTETDDSAGITFHRSEGDEHRTTGQCEYSTDKVANAIESFPFIHARYSTRD